MSAVAGDAGEQTLISTAQMLLNVREVSSQYPSRWHRRRNASRRIRSSAEVRPHHAGEAYLPYVHLILNDGTLVDVKSRERFQKQ